MIKWKQCMFGAVLAGAVCMNMPQAAALDFFKAKPAADPVDRLFQLQ